MANPQKENGHTPVANELLDAIIKLRLNSYEHSVLWTILRKTYGWNKKTDHISYTQFEEATHLDRRHIARTIKRLVQRNIIAKSGNGLSIEYGLQKDYEKWTYAQALPKQAMVSERCLDLHIPLPKQAMKALPKQANTKDNKDIIQKKVIPDFIDKDTWNDYLEMRRRKRAAATPRAQELVIKRLVDFKAQGQDVNKILEQSILKSWTDVYPVKNEIVDRVMR